MQVVDKAVVQSKRLVIRVIPKQCRMRADVAVQAEPVAFVQVLADTEEFQNERPKICPRQFADRGHVVEARTVKREGTRR